MNGFEQVDEKGWVFISDRQKGLLQVFSEKYPNAEHRFCLRHMYANFKDKFGSDNHLKKLFLKAASAGNVKQWECYMKEIDWVSPRQQGKVNAFDWLCKIPPTQ